MVVSSDAVIAFGSSIFLGVLGWLAVRSVSQIDDNIKELWRRYEKLSDRVANIEKRNHH